MERKPIWIVAAALVFGVLVVWSILEKYNNWPGSSGSSNPPTQSSSTGQTTSSSSTGQPTTAIAPKESGDAIQVSIASSSNKGEWIDQATASFNAASQKEAALQLNGKPVVVTAVLEGKEHYRSGTMVTDILSGKIMPVVASPAEDSWILKLNKEWQELNSKQLITKNIPGVARTPLVIAMWESRARALECWPSPKPRCSWETIRALATSLEGWKSYGRPDWGKFKIGYGYVGESNSGTLTSAILCMRGLGKSSGLTIDDVSPSNGCGQMIAAVEKAKVHSGKRSAWLLDRMRTGGPEYLDAIVTNEQEVIEFNHNQEGLREPMVSAYPQDGTVIITHPFAILDGAPWVSADQAKAAELFQKYLLSSEQQALLVKNGLRPANPQAPLGPPLEAAYGANPEANLNLLEVPEVLVFDRIREVWHEVKKHARIAIVFDKSSSMAGEKISYAVKGAQEFVSAMDTKDWLAWFAFDNEVYPLSQGYKSSIGEKLLADIRSTTAGGGTALYDAVSQAFDFVARDRRTIGDNVRYGIVILSDGKDTSSKNSTLTLLESRLQPSEGDPTGIQIHTIGIGEDSDEQVLKKIANLAHGRYWKVAKPADVVEVYKEIATYY
jgi:Ca-activated chloride channel homolog